MKEYILCAAIHCDDKKIHREQPDNIHSGFIVSGRRHSDCYAVIEALVGVDDYLRTIDVVNHRDHQGFLTNLNRYVSRKEGWQIALKAGQIKIGLEASDNGEDSILISENLY